MVFNDLDTLWRYAKNEMKDIVKTSLVEEIKNVEQDVIKEVVLDQYTPTYYDRRSEGNESEDGLISKNNMVADYLEGKDFIEINITNDTKGNNSYEGSVNGYIDEIIEYGDGYTWKGSQIAMNKIPRPFTKVTQQRIDDSDIVTNTIKKSVSFEVK